MIDNIHLLSWRWRTTPNPPRREAAKQRAIAAFSFCDSSSLQFNPRSRPEFHGNFYIFWEKDLASSYNWTKAEEKTKRKMTWPGYPFTFYRHPSLSLVRKKKEFFPFAFIFCGVSGRAAPHLQPTFFCLKAVRCVVAHRCTAGRDGYIGKDTHYSHTFYVLLHICVS